MPYLQLLLLLSLADVVAVDGLLLDKIARHASLDPLATAEHVDRRGTVAGVRAGARVARHSATMST